MKFLFIWFALFTTLFAKPSFVKLTSSDGKKTIEAQPIAVTGSSSDHIIFKLKNGKTVTTTPDRFSASDAKKLRDWASAMQRNPHQKILQRVKKALPLRVLFIGNSYSFIIPKEFERIARNEGQKVEVDQVTFGGWTLGQHAQSDKTLNKIAQKHWDIVVLQEQSLLPAFPENQRHSLMDPAVKTLAKAIRNVHAIPVLFLTWGRKSGDKQNTHVYPNDTFEAMQKRLIHGYSQASIAGGGLWIVPVGKVWAKLKSTPAGNNLYSKDGSHPAGAGNYLAGCVFYSAFYNQPVKRLNRRVSHVDIFSSTAAQFTALKPLPFPLPTQAQQ